MAYNFGRDIKYTFYPLKDEVSSDDYQDLQLVTTNPAIYIYNVLPTRTDAAAGTGALSGPITSWTNTEDGRGKEFTIPAISDPDTSSTNSKYDYYLIINFYLQDAAQLQTIIRLFPMRRVIGTGSSAIPEIDYLEKIHPDLSKFFNPFTITNAIHAATRVIKAKLKSSGFDQLEIWNPDELQDAIAYKALAQLALSNASGSNHWDVKHEEYKETADSLLGSVLLLVDTDTDGTPDQEQPKTNIITLIR